MRTTFILMATILSMATATAQHTFTVQRDVVFASPEGFDLTMDIYTPDTGKESYPVLIVYHGGGWLINNKSIMDEMSAYIAANGEYVVCNVNYRLLVNQDNSVTMNQIVEDAFGAVLWVKDHISSYSGDPGRIAVTGDSAGGHLAEMVVVCGNMLSNTGFDKKPLGFRPSYLPEGKTPEQIAASDGMRVQAAIISYGAFDIYTASQYGLEQPSNMFWQMGGGKARGIFGEKINLKDHPEYYKTVSPVYHIPAATERVLPPQLFTVGSNDNLTTPASIQAYVKIMKDSGQPAEYWEYKGRPHAFLDSGSNEFLGTSFEKDAPEAIDVMIGFLDRVFYNE